MGRSCILVTIGGKNVMLDCGMHMGYNDEVGGAGRACQADHAYKMAVPLSKDWV